MTTRHTHHEHPVPARLSEELTQLLAKAGTREEGMTIRDLQKALRGRAILVLVILMALPFSLPVSIPGMSTPFGLAIFLVSIRLAAGLPPWLPQFIRKVRIPQARLQKLLSAGIKASRKLERLISPRLGWLWATKWSEQLVWFMIALSALLLCLPLPIPFSNTLPGLAIIFMAIGIMEKDGLLVLGGLTSFTIGVAYFAALVLLGQVGISELFGNKAEAAP